MVLDTNVLISSLLTPKGLAASACDAWLDQRFLLLTAAPQIAEFKSTLRKPKIRQRVQPHRAGRLINDLITSAELLDSLLRVARSPDPDDNFLLSMAETGRADYLVTGDKAGLLLLKRHAGANILTLRAFVDLLAPGLSRLP